MSWSNPDRDLAAAIERRLREALVSGSALDAGRRGPIRIETLRVEAPAGATAEAIGERVTANLADRLRTGVRAGGRR